MTTSIRRHQTFNLWEPALQQQLFRQLLDAFAFPGAQPTPMLPQEAVANALLRLILATLIDGEVTLADPARLIPTEDWRKLETTNQAPEKARFIVARGDQAPTFTPALGSLECPEQGATIILRVAQISKGEALTLRGPGIASLTQVTCTGLDESWLQQRRDWNESFPLGVDMILCDDVRLMAWPRTTRISSKEGRPWDM
ncbi:phosphonate C-P lyase system protein PhnH [Pelovirga terrestris]|uniref:Phosphonate C-P lyase system protein PhnH n=1 Tax=Pelovirga terrestris TaxID=2771352 RepID=A0A8J6QQ40_9BACT|nr:phosphonate C-P lyase system protein PhnH [Pelovirga terrestris]MBD1400871.1 phosphonate C-P lyase system protein PhnH [Pelovirga terrestris]